MVGRDWFVSSDKGRRSSYFVSVLVDKIILCARGFLKLRFVSDGMLSIFDKIRGQKSSYFGSLL